MDDEVLPSPPNISAGTEPPDLLFNIDGKDDPRVTLTGIKAKNSNRLIIGHNINSIDKKFESLVSIFKDKIDIILISETKIDDTFPMGQFTVEGYSTPIRLDMVVGLFFYLISHVWKGILVEITIRKTKWLILGGYNPIKDNVSYYLSHISKEMDKLLGNYGNILMLGDFNYTVSETDMKDFCQIYDLHNLIKEPTCYKNAKNLSSIDVMLTNRKGSFQNSMVVETGLSDHHKMTVTVLKT